MTIKQRERMLTAGAGLENRLVTLAGVEVRADDDGPVGFKGHAAVFESRTQIGGKWGWAEEIARTAFDSALERPDDVRMLKNHNADLVLARTTAGNLRLSTDKVGLVVDADMTPTTYARDLGLSLAAGDVTAMSFGFVVRSDEWSLLDAGTDDESELRVITDVELWEVSPVTFPAFQDTDASIRAREMELVCRSLGFDNPDDRHRIVEALKRTEPDYDLATVLRAAATRLTERAETLTLPASDGGDETTPGLTELCARFELTARRLRAPLSA